MLKFMRLSRIIVLFLITFSIFSALIYAASPPPPPPCTIKISGCYKKVDIKVGSNELNPSEFDYFLPNDKCLRSGDCDCRNVPQNIVEERDPDISSGACTCIAGSDYNPNGKCCGDDIGISTTTQTISSQTTKTIEVLCESWSYKYAECPQTGNITSVSVVKQHSDSDCTLGSSYGYSNKTLWVNNGCRATFSVTVNVPPTAQTGNDCGRIVQGVLCSIDANAQSSKWVPSQSNIGGIEYAGCIDLEYLSEGANWTQCKALPTWKKIVSGHEYMCVNRGRESIVECCGDGACNSKIYGKRLSTGQYIVVDESKLNSTPIYLPTSLQQKTIIDNAHWHWPPLANGETACDKVFGAGWQEFGHFQESDVYSCKHPTIIQYTAGSTSKKLIEDVKTLSGAETVFGAECSSLGSEWEYFGASGINFCKKTINISYEQGTINILTYDGKELAATSILAIDDVKIVSAPKNPYPNYTHCKNTLGAGWEDAGWDGHTKMAFCKHFVDLPIGGTPPANVTPNQTIDNTIWRWSNTAGWSAIAPGGKVKDDFVLVNNDENNIYAIGMDNYVWRWNGVSWGIPSGMASKQIFHHIHLVGASQTSLDKLYGISLDNQLWRWSNTAGWSQIAPGNYIKDDFVLVNNDENNIYAIGTDNKVWHWNGLNWARVTIADEYISQNIHFLDKVNGNHRGYGIGSDNKIWKLENANWQQIAPGKDIKDDFHFISENDIYAIGIDNYIWHWNGASWSRVTMTPNQISQRLYFASPTLMFGIGIAPSASTPNVSTTSINETLYCRTDAKFATDLDTPEAESTCKKAGFIWTGTKCCSEADDQNEYYNDPGGIGGCWNKKAVISVDFVNGTNESVVNYNGEFHGCAIDKTNYNTGNNNLLSLTDKHTGAALITNHDYCFADPQQNYYCSFTEKWRSTEGINRTHISYSPLSNASQKAECCPANECWDGSSCIANQRSNPLAQPIGNTSKRCIDGEWAEANKKCAPDGSVCGYCPQPTQCLVNAFGTTNVTQCIESGQFIDDNYCSAGSWMTRTNLLALELLKLKGADHSLFCDTKENTLNYLQYITASGELASTALTNLKTNNFCVLKSGAQVTVGTSINQGIANISKNDLSAFGISSCDTALSFNDGQYHPCDQTNKVWLNKVTISVIYSSTPLSIPSASSGSFEGLIKNPINNVTTSIKSLIPNPPFDDSYVNAFNKLDRIYFAQQNNSIAGAIEGKDFKNLVVKYSGFDTDICKFVNEFNQTKNAQLSGIICKNETNNHYVLAQGSQFTSLNPESIWADLTAKLKLK